MLSTQALSLSGRAVARRAVIVAGQRRAVVEAARRLGAAPLRALQTVAQTDRVRTLLLFKRNPSLPHVLTSLNPGYYHQVALLYRHQA